MPATTTVGRLFVTRGVRAVVDGLVAASLASLLLARGHDEATVGVVVTATLLGSATTLLAVARFPEHLTPSRVLLANAILMVITGVVFGLVDALAVLLAVAVVGPLNPTGGDVSAFLPAEQALIADEVAGTDRTTTYARYALVGAAGAAVGAWMAGPVAAWGRAAGMGGTDGVALAFVVYAAGGAVVGVLYHRSARGRPARAEPHSRLGPSRGNVRALSVLFALDSAGGGLAANSLTAAWLLTRFDFRLSQVGLVLGLSSLASAASALVAPRMSRRFGLVETMVVTHLPANALLIAAGLAGSATTVVVLLIARALLSQLDVPPRQAFVMSIVTPAERAAAAVATNLPRSLAAASTPVLGGWLLTRSDVGWPLVLGGAMKATYDVLLWFRFRHLSARM